MGVKRWIYMNKVNQNRVRYDGLDVLKCICAFLVVCIHAAFLGDVGKIVEVIARIAVPIFFMITGFFYLTLLLVTNLNLKIYLE